MATKTKALKEGTIFLATRLDMSELVTADQLAELWGSSENINEALIEDLNRSLDTFQINTPQRITHFLSQVSHESGAGKWFLELADGMAYEGRADLGNTQPGDGPLFKGAGALQMTGRDNYAQLWKRTADDNVMELGAPYVASAYPFTSAGVWWEINRMNRLCDAGISVQDMTKRVNGGFNGLSQREAYYKKACAIWAPAPTSKLTLVSTHSTFAKKQPIPAIQLPEGQKAEFPAGRTLAGCVRTRAPQKDGHTEVVLPFGMGTWWLYDGHWQGLPDDVDPVPVPTKSASVIDLKVPEWLQTDNYTQPNRTCNATACAMALAYLKPGSIQTDNEYLHKFLDGGYGDSTDHNAHTRLLEDYGLKSKFVRDMSFADLDAELEAGRPVVIGILHRGTEAYPTGGHMITVRGKLKNGSYIVNDPYGSVYDGYSGPPENGKRAIYRRETLGARWLPEGPNSGWGRVFLPG